MNNLTQRIITAVVLVAALLAALFVLPAPAGQLFLGVFLAVGAWEWAGFLPGATPLRRLFFVAALVLIAAYGWAEPLSRATIMPVLLAASAYWAGALLLMAAGPALRNPWLIGLAGACGLLFAWFAVSFLLQADADGPAKFIWCAALVAAADIGAYFTGKNFGRRKLAPTISPGKTVEGLAGGTVAAACAGAAGAALFGLSAPVFAVAGALIACVSVVGDLWVSRFKRAAGLKDSGRALPGHGGVLDRIDSLIAALPLFVLAVAAVGGDAA